MGAIVWEKALDEDVLGDCVLAIRPACSPVDGLPSTGHGGRIGEGARQAGRSSGRLGAGVAPAPHGGYRLPLAEPGAGGERLIEPVRAERLADLGYQLGLPPP